MTRTTIEIPISTNLRPDMINDIRNEVARNNQRLKRHGLTSAIYADEQKSSLLLVKTCAEWMHQEYGKPQPRKLFGDFWHEGELCILFADTNLGKSILAVQIGNHLSKADCMQPFANQLPGPAIVLYVDFEMNAKQFESRYYHSQWGSLHFGHTFYRAEFNPQADNPALYDNYDEYLTQSLEAAISKTKAQVVIIDNLTYMRRGTERAKDALPLMKQLKALKTKHNLSILALAHTPKRKGNKPLTLNDLQGSKMLINFCDSAFAIGESQNTSGARYFKQIKQRNAQQTYGEENVCVCHIDKELNNLHYVFDGYAHEESHLQKRDRHLLRQQALHLKQQGHSYRQISQALNIGLATIARLLDGEKHNTQTEPTEPNQPSEKVL